MNATCERCSALFETSSERPSRYCSSCREMVRAEANAFNTPAAHAISDRPSPAPRYLDDPYGDYDASDVELRPIKPTPEDQRLADSGGRGLIWGGWLVIFSTILNSVLGFFNLAEILPADPNFQNIPEDVKNAMFIGMIAGIGCVAMLTLIPTIFMILGGNALRRFSSRGLGITGAVFTFLMVAWFGVSLVIAILGVAVGDNEELRRLSTASIIRAVILHVLEVFCIVFWTIAGIRALRILGRPEIGRIFNANAHERLYPSR